MSKRKGNVILVSMFLLGFIVYGSSRWWTHHAVAPSVSIPGSCEWKQTDWILKEYAYICGGRAEGTVWKRTNGLWSTMHGSLEGFTTKEAAMQDELASIKKEQKP